MDLPQRKTGTSVKPDSPPDHSDDCEQKLLKTLSDIADEAQRVKDHWVKDVDLTRDLDLYRGKLKGNADDRYFDCNFVGAFIDRMVAQLTDNRPINRLENRKAGISKVARSVDAFRDFLPKNLHCFGLALLIAFALRFGERVLILSHKRIDRTNPLFAIHLRQGCVFTLDICTAELRN